MTGLKKNLDLSHREKLKLIDKTNNKISISRQAELLGISRSSIYYRPVIDLYDITLMQLIDKQYTKTPFYGSRKMTAFLKRNGYEVNRKKVIRLMQQMGLEAIYPKPNLSKSNSEHKIYPYLLKGLSINKANHVWATDITYIKLHQGWLYLIVIMDWFSRYVISWQTSTSLEVDFCLIALDKALKLGTPEIFNSDQGPQFTALSFTQMLIGKSIKISMDGRGRAHDNIFTERLWRSLKYEEVYLKDYQSVQEAEQGIGNYLTFYNHERLHQSLNYLTPAEVYFN